MERINRSAFDKEWQGVFAGAEVPVPVRVWEGIERNLEANNGSGGRKGLLVITLLIAASLVLAMSVGGILYFQNNNFLQFGHSTISEKGNIVKEDEKVINGDTKSDATDTNQDSNSKNSGTSTMSEPDLKNLKDNADHDQLKDQRKKEELKGQPTEKGSLAGLNNPSELPSKQYTTASQGKNSTNKQIDYSKTGSQESLPLETNRDQMVLENISALPAQTESLTKLESVDMIGVPYYASTQKRNEKNSDAIWASVGMSAGSYNGSSTPADQNFVKGTAQFGSERAYTDRGASGQVVNIGANIGSKIGRNWVLQGGVGYMEKISKGESNVVSLEKGKSDVVSFIADSHQLTEELKTTDKYSFEDTYQILSIPVQVGYVFLDKKVGIVLLSGLSNDLLIQRKLQSDDGMIDEVTFKPGDSPQYNSYGISALVTTEVSYELGKHYAITLFPQLRQALKPVNEIENDTENSKPIIWELGFRFRYLFR